MFLVKAALDYDPKDAIGLDGALQKLAHQSYGPYLLGLTAAGLVSYGVYCLVDARYRAVEGAANASGNTSNRLLLAPGRGGRWGP